MAPAGRRHEVSRKEFNADSDFPVMLGYDDFLEYPDYASAKGFEEQLYTLMDEVLAGESEE